MLSDSGRPTRDAGGIGDVDDRSRFFVARISGREVIDFLLDCTDDRYRQWWPGTHLELHALTRGRDHLGDVALMDEYVGKRRVRMLGIVVQVVPGKKIVWQLRKGVRLPVWLTLELADRDGGSSCGTRSRPASVASAGSSTRFSGAISPPSSPPRWMSTPGPSSRFCGTTSPDFLIVVGDRERDLQQMARLSREGRRGGADTRPGCRLKETARFLEFSLG